MEMNSGKFEKEVDEDIGEEEEAEELEDKRNEKAEKRKTKEK